MRSYGSVVAAVLGVALCSRLEASWGAALVLGHGAASVPSARAAEPRPDIVIERWTTPAAVLAGDVVSVTVHLTNVGSAEAGRFASELRLDAPVLGRVRIRPTRWDTKRLKTGERVEAAIELPIPASAPPGEYVLRVQADIDDEVPEQNEHNNLAERRLVVSAPPRSR